VTRWHKMHVMSNGILDKKILLITRVNIIQGCITKPFAPGIYTRRILPQFHLSSNQTQHSERVYWNPNPGVRM
jgi:hypothetical protein